MKTVALVPYCPWPADTGGKVEMWKQLRVLRELGACTILSAGRRPVGAGWTETNRRYVEAQGFRVILREETERLSPVQRAGIAYAAAAKGLRLEKAFGHSNPYHRHAFPADWWRQWTEQADLAVINYSYWAHLPCACPKVVVLLDLWSDYMWEGAARETADLLTADLVVVISREEEDKLRGRGIRNLLWSPPAVAPVACPDAGAVGLLGSANRFNRVGLRWLRSARPRPDVTVNVYGGVAGSVGAAPGFVARGAYEDSSQPYRECGVILMPTAQGMGVQIKAIEALAHGRAIVARRGAMRGLPPGEGAWIEVSTPDEMLTAAAALERDATRRNALAARAREYYRRHLDHEMIRRQLREAFARVAKVSGGG